MPHGRGSRTGVSSTASSMSCGRSARTSSMSCIRCGCLRRSRRPSGSTCHHIPWGTDYAIHESRFDAPPGDELVLGFMGTLLRHKGPHVVVQAMRLQPDLPIRLLLYGGSFHEEDYERELREIAGGDER